MRILAFFLLLTLALQAQVTPTAIYHAKDAPSSVQEAATELQATIRKATGDTLPIVHQPAEAMICLGDNPSSAAAGLIGTNLPYETCRILTHQGSVYIVGHDLADGDYTPSGGTSKGTLLGTYTFLEQALGVRWLMPKEIGEYIPKLDRLVIPALDITDAPDFPYRKLSFTAPPPVREWLQRNKIGRVPGYKNEPDHGSYIVHAGHNWHGFIESEVYQAHPEWHAVKGQSNKFCTRHPEAVRAFADFLADQLAANPRMKMVVAGASDGQHFCRCERCAPHIEVDPHGVDSFTVNLLTFYNEVARIFANEHPGIVVGGLVYGRNAYPPQADIELEPNLLLNWAPLNYYGLGLYKPGYRDEYVQVATVWAELAPRIATLSYDYWHRDQVGAPLAPPIDIFKLQFPLLRDLGFLGIDQAGLNAWGYGGPTNYLLAKLMWDADADIDALYDEWLTLAYGGAKTPMQQLYSLIDNAYKHYKAEEESFRYTAGDYEITALKIEKLYLPILPKIEQLYFQALEQAGSGIHRQRVELFGENLILFYNNIDRAGYLDNPKMSRLYRDDQAFAEFKKQVNIIGVGFHMKPVAPRPLVLDYIQEHRKVQIPRLQPDQAPTIDGKLTDSAWQQAAVANNFRGRSKTPAKQETTVRLAYDETAIYIAFDCPEDYMKQLQVMGDEDDDNTIYQGTTVELFLRPDEASEPWHLVVNPANIRWDGFGDAGGLDLDWESAVATSDNGWTVEIALPFASLGQTDPAGQTWRGNLGRVTVSPDFRSVTSWNTVAKSLLEPSALGRWVFAK